MPSIRTVAALLSCLLMLGCALAEQRERTIRAEHPQWPEETVRKLASRHVEPGMTQEMVRSALGKPDLVLEEGGEDVWVYAVWVVTYSSQNLKPVYWVRFRNGIVTRTEGNVDSLRTLE